jgi:hypothetical protein
VVPVVVGKEEIILLAQLKAKTLQQIPAVAEAAVVVVVVQPQVVMVHPE